MCIKNVVLTVLLAYTFSFAQADSIGVDCLILEDENSIICKYTHKRVDFNKDIIFHWIDPNEKLSRERNITIPAHHGSVYDFRYIGGRMPGVWTFKTIDGDIEYKTNFTIE